MNKVAKVTMHTSYIMPAERMPFLIKSRVCAVKEWKLNFKS